MIFEIPKNIVLYPELKGRLIKNFWILSAITFVGLLFLGLQWAMLYISGSIVGFSYMYSLFMTAEFPQRRMVIFLSIVRMAVIGFIIVCLGQFKVLETGVVFWGFLSYKIILVLEFFRYSVGMKLNRGK